MSSRRGISRSLFTSALALSLLSSHPLCSRPLSFTEYDDSIRSSVKKNWPDLPDWLWWKAQLFQESRLEPGAHSPAGAEGLAQFMPGTWADVTHQLGWSGISSNQAAPAIEAGAFYMARLRRSWTADRPILQRHYLGMASYNAGMGNVLRAQKLCGGVRYWFSMLLCLPQVTGQNARETVDYVERVRRWRAELEIRNAVQ